MYYTYVLQSEKDRKLYIGYTNDVRRRLAEHNSGESLSTAPRRPFTLIYCESYRNKRDALVREKFLKTGWGRNYLNRVLENYFKDKS